MIQKAGTFDSQLNGRAFYNSAEGNYLNVSIVVVSP